MSNRFQIYVPKSVREEKQWQAGQEFVFIPSGNGVLMIPAPELDQLAGIARGAFKDGYRDREDVHSVANDHAKPPLKCP